MSRAPCHVESVREDAAYLALTGLICLTPWFAYQARLPVADEDFVKLITVQNLMGGLTRLPYIVRSLVKEFLLKPHLWSLLGLSTAFLILRSPRTAVRSRFSLLLWIPILYVVVLCAIFMVIPWKLEELFPVALTRLMMHTAPLLFLWICFELGNSGLLTKEGRQQSQGPILSKSLKQSSECL